MSTNYQKFITTVADQVIDYAKKYDCTYADSLWDWEGDGPEGSFGLTSGEKYAVSKELRRRGIKHIDDKPVIDCDTSSTEDAGVEDLTFLDREQYS